MTRTGRPTVIDDDAVRKLEEAFFIDCTVKEACSRANIGKTAYYDRLEKDQDFAEKMEAAKDWAITSARARLFEEATKEGGDWRAALEIVKRRDKKRYSERFEDTGADGEAKQTNLIVKFE